MLKQTKVMEKLGVSLLFPTTVVRFAEPVTMPGSSKGATVDGSTDRMWNACHLYF